ncbi:MAG: agmatinase [Saprospiraceae bacterium]|jgi:agmatinase
MRTFAGIEEQYADRKNAAVYLQSIPYDGTSTWGKGADKGFAAFMDAAENMELYDIETNSEVYKEGIHLLEDSPSFESPEEMYQYTYENTKQLLWEGKFLTFFGGEHSVSIGLIKAHYEHFEDLTILQIDAHADLRPSYGGTAYNHACAVYDASKNANLVQVGIRSMDISEKEHMNYDKVFFADEIKYGGLWQDQALDQLTENVYITLDLDAFDPSILPGTGTPEPGGLDWYTVINFLATIFEQRNVVGFDIVELAPIVGHKASEFLAAKLYYKMLSYKFA